MPVKEIGLKITEGPIIIGIISGVTRIVAGLLFIIDSLSLLNLSGIEAFSNV